MRRNSQSVGVPVAIHFPVSFSPPLLGPSELGRTGVSFVFAEIVCKRLVTFSKKFALPTVFMCVWRRGKKKKKKEMCLISSCPRFVLFLFPFLLLHPPTLAAMQGDLLDLVWKQAFGLATWNISLQHSHPFPLKLVFPFFPQQVCSCVSHDIVNYYIHIMHNILHVLYILCIFWSSLQLRDFAALQSHGAARSCKVTSCKALQLRDLQLKPLKLQVTEHNIQSQSTTRRPLTSSSCKSRTTTFM